MSTLSCLLLPRELVHHCSAVDANDLGVDKSDANILGLIGSQVLLVSLPQSLCLANERVVVIQDGKDVSYMRSTQPWEHLVRPTDELLVPSVGRSFLSPDVG